MFNSQVELAAAPMFIIQTRQVQLSYNICQLIIKTGNIYIYIDEVHFAINQVQRISGESTYNTDQT